MHTYEETINEEDYVKFVQMINNFLFFCWEFKTTDNFIRINLK